MIDRSRNLPVARQALALDISRGSVSYLPRPVAASDLVVMRRIDELRLNFPFAGSRMLPATCWLAKASRSGACTIRDADEAHGDRGALSSQAST